MIENEDYIYVSCVKNTTTYLARDQDKPILAQGKILNLFFVINTSADLEVQLVQLNHCDGVYSNY